ncbi:MAG: hypothetical protein AB1656_25660 [Candidatus Omnitrophota bacterium]
MYTYKLKLFYILFLLLNSLNLYSQDTKIDLSIPILSKYKILNSTSKIIIDNATKDGWIFVEKKSDRPEDRSIRDKVHGILTSENVIYEPCEPIVIDATYINISDKTIDYYDSRPYVDNLIYVYNDKDEEISLTIYGESVLGDIKKGIIDVFRNVIMSLKPQKHIHFKILINRLFDMTQNGTYKINIKRTFYDREKGTYCEVPTNTLEIIVSDKNGELPTIFYSPKLSREDEAWNNNINRPSSNNDQQKNEKNNN